MHWSNSLLLTPLLVTACQTAPTMPAGATALPVTEMTARWQGAIPADATVIVDRHSESAGRFTAVIVGSDGRAIDRLAGALADLPRLGAAVFAATGGTLIEADGVTPGVGPHCEPVSGTTPVGDPCPPGQGPTGTNKQ